MKERYCPYCVRFKHDEGFKTIVHPVTGSKRMMCMPCQEIRKKPHKELVALSKLEKLGRKKI